MSRIIRRTKPSVALVQGHARCWREIARDLKAQRIRVHKNESLDASASENVCGGGTSAAASDDSDGRTLEPRDFLAAEKLSDSRSLFVGFVSGAVFVGDKFSRFATESDTDGEHLGNRDAFAVKPCLPTERETTVCVFLRGQIFDSATFAGLRGAIVSLDALPADGTLEFSTSANAFGFIRTTNVPPGSYQLRSAHPGYTPRVQDEIFTVGTNLSRRLPLTRLAGDPARFNIFVDVACVKSGLRLGNVRVRIDRYAGAADTTLEESFTNVTDSTGLAVLSGARIGYYVFSVNNSTNGAARTKWESFDTPRRRELRAPHVAQALLKPVGQDMTMRVLGFDPRQGRRGLSNVPLKEIYVELEGLNPNDPKEVLLPTRVGVTDLAGDAKFKDLPAIACRVIAKRLGYTPTTHVIFPSFSDVLAPLTTLTLEPMLAPFGVFLDSPYLNPTLMTGLVMRVEGLTNSNTEGIVREASTLLIDPPGPPPPFADAAVPGLAVNSAGEFHLPWNSTGGDVRLSRFNGISAWTLLGAPATEVIANELQLAPLASGGSNIWMLAWIDGSDATALHYAVASATGATLKTNTAAAFADTGRYSHLHLQPEAGLTARLLARHTGTNNVTNLREFLATPAGIAPWLLNATPLIGGGLQFDLLASPNQTFRLQGSSNFVDWIDLLNFTATNSPVIIQDNTLLPHRFYRAVTP